MSDHRPPPSEHKLPSSEKALPDTAFASLRHNLGVICDEYARGRAALLRKISAQIELETDPTKLLVLQGHLNQALLGSADVTFANTVLTLFHQLSAAHTAHLVTQSGKRAEMERAGQVTPP